MGTHKLEPRPVTSDICLTKCDPNMQYTLQRARRETAPFDVADKTGMYVWDITRCGACGQWVICYFVVISTRLATCNTEMSATAPARRAALGQTRRRSGQIWELP
ncbi:hypothetical protein EVAR_30964_1 [Eumeta japonica]|uniref:Uncharacterized protein n=1 Tax=Eumeta variegata TaxID=151549 RepID=A0A4C1W8V6_EUMVA|nr:hypothetical protein EVAR_30964_1 [Eumeta japonica]